MSVEVESELRLLLVEERKDHAVTRKELGRLREENKILTGAQDDVMRLVVDLRKEIDRHIKWVADAASLSQSKQPTIDIVFDGLPSHESGRFVEVEDVDGKSIRIGQWIPRPNGLYALRLPDPRQIAALNKWISDLQAGLSINCVYCGYNYGPNHTEIAQDVLRQHIAACDKHPMADLMRCLRQAGETIMDCLALLDGKWTRLEALAEDITQTLKRATT